MPKTPAKKPRASAAKASKTPAPVRREAGAVACVLLAVFCVLGLAGVRALFLTFLTDALYRLIGAGA